MTAWPLAFALSDRLAAKADPALIAADTEHFAAIRTALGNAVDELEQRLARARRAPLGEGATAVERDFEVHRVTARLRALRRYGLDLCLGRMLNEQGEAVYVGRVGLRDGAGRQLLVDWRSPAAAPFFAATQAHTMGLRSRRRYRWTDGRITDYWDEILSPAGLTDTAALDDQSAFLASLGSSRSPRMRDVLGTIQSEQDAIIRADSRGALVVDGGPGTGKTVVALHRSAYLLHADPRVDHRHGGVLFVGPHQPYLDYVADVLPSLGEDGVRTCTLRDLTAEAAPTGRERDPQLTRLKSDARMSEAIDAAVRFYEDPPTAPLVVETDSGELWITADDWADAFGAVEAGTPHNEAREQIIEELDEILNDRHPDESPQALRRSVLRDEAVTTTLARAWPLIDPADLLADLWSVPAYLRRCAPWLSAEEVHALQRDDARSWTEADLPLLDAARHRLGDPVASRQRRQRESALAAEREERARVVDHLIASDDSELLVMSMLRGQDLQSALVDETSLPAAEPDRLAGPFAHVVVDEAQELTDTQWQMLLRRCPSGSFTIVGDRAQARHGFTQTWQQRLEQVGLTEVRLTSLTINYRTPVEIMSEAEPVIRVVLPDANVPTSIRSSGVPVEHASTNERDALIAAWLDRNDEGLACVIGDSSFAPAPRVHSLDAELAKGLEFDLVVLVDPERFGDGIEGAVDRYVAMTRATQRLVILTS